MKKKILTSILVLVVILASITIPSKNVKDVHAEETETPKYTLSGYLVNQEDNYELSVGDTIYPYAKLVDINGNAADKTTWEFYSNKVMEDANCLSYYSEYDNEEQSKIDAVTFKGKIPAAAFGKYIYTYVGAHSTNNTNELLAVNVIRSDRTVTSWADSDYFTISLNNSQKKTVSIYSIWDCDSANFKSTITIYGKKYKVNAIMNDALEDAGRSSIESLTIPNDVRTIGENAFKNASRLKTIIIKANLSSVGKNAFKGINKNAVFKIKATKEHYKLMVKLIKNSGIPKTVKFMRI